MVIHSTVDDAGLSPREFRVLAAVCRRCGDGGNGRQCDASIKTLAATCKIHEDTAREILARLIELGWIEMIERPGRSKVHVAKFPDRSGCKGGVVIEGGGSESRESTGFKGGHPSSSEGEHPSGIKGGEGIPSKGSQRRDTTSLREAIWAAAPPRGRERSSRDKLGAALKKIPKEITDKTILDSLEEWKRSDSWTKENGQYVSGIHVWVKDRKWETNPAPAGNANTTTGQMSLEATKRLLGGRAKYLKNEETI